MKKALLTSILEPTNEPYSIAVIAGIKMCESYNRQYSRDYRSVMPSKLYKPRDNYHSTNSHVVPALIRRFHEAKKNNTNFALNTKPNLSHKNIGSHEEVTIRALSEKIRKVIGFQCKFDFENEKPDGSPRKYIESVKINSLE